MKVEELDYVLPEERIAQTPMEPRDASRLLVVDRESGERFELAFRDLRDHIGSTDLLVVNDTRVRPAKLRGHKRSGGKAEALLLERRPDATWRAFLKCAGRQREGLELEFGGVVARVVECVADGSCRLAFESDANTDTDPETLLNQIGEAPLPPYIERASAEKDDLTRYQTIFARAPGAVAAPTASLHFTPELAAALPIATLTLHVGPGTFRPLRGESVSEHLLDAEDYEVPEATAAAIRAAKSRGGRVIAVGTTVVRALETLGGNAGSGSTQLLIEPGYRFQVVDSLITNFHLPRSSLLALVMAFAGVETIRSAYEHAIAEQFRFYSYGDAMWIR